MAFIQQKAEQSTSSVSSFTSTAMSVAAGNSIVACMCCNINTATSLVASDSKSNAYTLAKLQSTINGGVSIYVAPLILGGSTTYTVTPSSAAFVSISAQEYSGMLTVNPGEATNGAGPTSSNNISPGAVNPASTNDLYVACWSHSGAASQTFTANLSGEGWTLRSNLTNTANQPLGSQDIVSSGSRTGSAGLGGAAAIWYAAVATFKSGPTFVSRGRRPFPFKPGSPPSYR